MKLNNEENLKIKENERNEHVLIDIGKMEIHNKIRTNYTRELKEREK